MIILGSYNLQCFQVTQVVKDSIRQIGDLV